MRCAQDLVEAFFLTTEGEAEDRLQGLGKLEVYRR